MKWSKSRAVMVVGACLSNVWCVQPGNVAPRPGVARPQLTGCLRHSVACPQLVPLSQTTNAQLDGGAVICTLLDEHRGKCREP